ncbi:DUF5776 domain-containing protein [Apilactobacillus quenuiae]|uniref:DUF5776 domain-containing protein n=1 Tax=Apilactobacillus quenuiae TaxID=2008377 RepID=UPI000D01E826|nr:DUF5776 domain-containing protein [Apilactobacillus quenuiae]
MYNKNEFNKINDKKVLHKVKKQWITISVSMFAALGAAGITIYNSPNAEADTVNTNQETITNNDNLKHDGNQVISNTTNNNNNGKSLPSTSNDSNNHEDEQPAKIADDHNVQNVSNNNGHVNSEPKASNVTSGHDSAASDSGSQGSASTQGSHSSAANSGSSQAPANGSPESKAAVSASSVHNSAANNEEQHGSLRIPSSGTPTTEQAPNFHISDGMLKDLDEKSLASVFSQQLTASTSNALDDEEKQAAINGAVAAWNAIHLDAKQPVNQDVNAYNRYYQSGYQGVQDAWKTYNSLNGSLGTQSVKSYNGNNASNPNDPKSVDPNLNSQKHSITDPTQNVQAVNDPLAKTQNANVVSPSSDKVFVNSGVQAPIDMDSYNWGVNYFLKEQGTYDAETGRWSADPNSVDVYRPSENSDNAYDQSYLGAKDAISQQFKADDTFNYNVNSPSTFAPKMSITASSDDYQLGFNDVITKVKNGTAFVTNAIQINNSIDTQNQKNSTQSQSLPAQGVTIQSNNSIKDIRFMNDIDFQPTNYAATTNNNTYVYIQPTGSSYNLTFDGQNHVTDFQGLTYSLDPAGSPDHNSNNLTVKNFATAYGANYWGMAKVENQYATLHVSNLTYVGGQFTSSANGWVDISGNVNLFSLGVYRSPFNDYNVTNESSYWSNSGINNGSTQENIEAANLNIQSGANFYGSTTGGTSLAIGHDTNISGMGGNNLVVGQDANVELLPFYNAVKPNTGAYGDTTDGIFLNGNNSGNFIVKKNANVIINAKGNSYVAKPLYITNAQTIIDGGNVTINMNGAVNSGNANYLGGGQTSPWIPNSYTAGLITNGGNLIVNADDLNGVTNSVNGGTYSSSSYNGDIIYNYYSLFVNKGGNFKVTTDGSGNNPTLLYSGNGLYLDSPGNVNLQVGNNGIINQEPIYAYNTAYAINSNGVSPQHYEIYVPKSNSGNISYAANGGMTTSNDNITNAQSLTFQQANPTGYFNGPIEVQQNADKSNVLTGTFKVNNLSSTNNGNINLQINIDGKRIDPSILKNGKFILLDQNGNVISNLNDTGSNISVPNQVVSVGSSNSANPTFSYGNVPYDDSILIPQNAQNGDQIVFYYELPKGTPNSTVQVNANYFNNIETQTLTKNNDGSANVSDALNNPLYGNDPIDNTTLQNFVKSPYEPSDIDAENDAIADAIDNVSNNKTNVNDYHNGKNWYKYEPYTSNGNPHNLYKTYYTDAYNGYIKGLNDYQANNDSYNQAQLTYNLANTFAMQQGYNAVYNDVSNGFTDRVVNNNTNNGHANNAMYTLGFDYGSGALDVMQNNHQNSNADANYGIGYQNLINGINHNNDHSSLAYQFNPAYQYGTQMMQGYQDTNNQAPARNEQTFDLDAYQNGQAFYDGLKDVISNANNLSEYNFINNQNIYYNLAQSLFGNGLNNTTQFVTNDLSQTALNTGIAARTGINDAISNNSNSLENYSGLQQQAYQNAQSAFNDGSSGINNSNNAGLNPYANQVGLAAYTGTVDALSGNNNKSKYQDQLQQNAYNNAQLAFSAISSGNVNNNGSGNLNTYASQVGQAAQDGLNSMINGTSDNNNYYTDSNKQKAYENARLAYYTGQNTRDNTSATANLNIFANSIGIIAYDSLNDALAGNQNTKANAKNSFAQAAYDYVQSAYNAGLANKPITDADAMRNNIAWAVGQAALKAINDEINGSPDGSSGYSNNSQSQQAYINAWQAYEEGKKNQTYTTLAKQNIEANAIGNAAYFGLSDAINNNPKNDNNYSDSYKNLEQQAYDNAWQAYVDGQQGRNNNTNSAANQLGFLSRQGLNDAINGYDNSNNYNDLSQLAYSNSQKYYKAGQNDLDQNNTAEINKSHELYDFAYIAGQVSYKRLNAIIYGESSNYKDYVRPNNSSDNNNDLNDKAYDNAQILYADGQNNNSGFDKNQLPFASGLAYNAGVQDSISNNINKNKYKNTEQQAYENALNDYQNLQKNIQNGQDNEAYRSNRAAFDGMMDAVNGNSVYYNLDKDNYFSGKSYSDNLNNIYQGSKTSYYIGTRGENGNISNFNKESNDLGQVAYQGIQDVIVNSYGHYPNDTSNPNYVVETRAYLNAQTAYKTGLSGQITSLNDYASRVGKVVYDAMINANNGNLSTTNITNIDLTSNDSTENTNLQSIYVDAIHAYIAGQNNNTGKDSYNNEYQDLGNKNYVANQAGLASYQGLQDALAGNNDLSNSQSEPFTKDAYENARNAYIAGQNNNLGQDINGNNYQDLGNKNTTANQAGLVSYNVLHQLIYGGSYVAPGDKLAQTASQNTMTAYQAGFGINNSNNNFQLYNAAYTAGQSAQQALTDVIAGNPANPQGNSDQQKAYNNARQAYQDGIKGSNNNVNVYANNIGFAVKAAINDSLADKKYNSYSQNGQFNKYYEAAYNSTKQGFNGDTTSSIATANSIANIAGLYAKQALSNALAGVPNQADNINNTDSTTETIAKQTYNNAYNSYTAGFNGDTSSATAEQNSYANSLGKIAYDGLMSIMNGDLSIPADYKNDNIKHQLYQNLLLAYQAGVNGDDQSDNAKLSSIANNAGIYNRKALDDSVNGRPDDTVNIYDFFERNSYNNTRKAYLAGLMGLTSGSDATLNANANQAGLAAFAGLNNMIYGNAAKAGSYSDGSFAQQAYNHAQQSYQAGENNLYNNYDSNANIENTIAYDAGQAAHVGLKDAISGNQNHLSNYVNNLIQRTAYNHAIIAYQAGTSGDFNSNQAKLDMIANNIGKAAYNGLIAAENNSKNNQPDHQDILAYQAYNQAQTAYDNGLNQQTDDTNSVANNAGKAANNALNDAIYNNNINQPSDINSPAGMIYKQIQQAYNLGINGITTTDNVSANNVGLAAHQGLFNIVNGKNDNVPVDQHLSQYQAYQYAQQSYVAGENSDNPNAGQLNIYAYRSGQAARNGLMDLIDNNSDETSRYSSDNFDQQAYSNARQAYLIGENSANNDGQSVATAKAMNNTAYDAGLAAYDGVKDAVDNKDNHEDGKYSELDRQAYVNASQSYNYGLNGNLNVKTGNVESYADQIGLAARRGILHAINGQSTPPTNALQKHAYLQAQQAYQAGQNNNHTAQNQQMAMLNKVANNAGLASYVGLQDAINNNSDHEANYRSNLVQFQAYINAQRMYQAGQSGHQDNSNSESIQAGTASKAGLNDAINGVPDNPNKYPDNLNQQKAYENARAAYQAGLTGDRQSNNAKLDSAANQAGYAVWINTKNNHNSNQPAKPNPTPSPNPAPTPTSTPSDNNQSMPTPPSKRPIKNDDGFKAGINAFANGRQPSLTGKSAAYINNFNRGYDEAEQGFNDKHNAIISNNAAYNDGHKNFHDYQKGIFDAQHNRQGRLNGNYAYQVGQQAYQAGMNGTVVNYNRIDKAYRSSYKYAYNLAYKKRLHDIPHYVYNYNTIYSYKVLKFNNKDRLIRYKKVERNKSHVFRVVGFRFTKTGKLYYRLAGGGWITSNRGYIDDAYYHKSRPAAKNKFRVIKPTGTYVYSSRKFSNHTMIRHLKKGDTFHVKYIETYGKMTRMYLGNGEYVSSNKTIVERIK